MKGTNMSALLARLVAEMRAVLSNVKKYWNGLQKELRSFIITVLTLILAVGMAAGLGATNTTAKQPTHPSVSNSTSWGSYPIIPAPTKPKPKPKPKPVPVPNKGVSTTWVQQRLRAWGYSLTVDGVMGSTTINDIESFQANHGLVADGIVGPVTAAKLAAVPTSTAPVPSPNYPCGNLTESQLAQLWIDAGGNPAYAHIASAIAMAESSGRQYAADYDSNGSVDRGYWQINSCWGYLSTFDALGNAKAAIYISHDGTDWYPWVTYTSGAYLRYM